MVLKHNWHLEESVQESNWAGQRADRVQTTGAKA
jgi:hypothetical protein